MTLVIAISDMGGYDKNKAGSYVLTYTATDKGKNVGTNTRAVLVKETLDVRLDAISVGE